MDWLSKYTLRCKQMLDIQRDGFELFKRKNKDYGDAFAAYGVIGVIVRIGDKINRLININKNQINLVDDESMEDTLIDLHNYAALALILLRENKELKEK